MRIMTLIEFVFDRYKRKDVSKKNDQLELYCVWNGDKKRIEAINLCAMFPS